MDLGDTASRNALAARESEARLLGSRRSSTSLLQRRKLNLKANLESGSS